MRASRSGFSGGRTKGLSEARSVSSVQEDFLRYRRLIIAGYIHVHRVDTCTQVAGPTEAGAGLDECPLHIATHIQYDKMNLYMYEYLSSYDQDVCASRRLTERACCPLVQYEHSYCTYVAVGHHKACLSARKKSERSPKRFTLVCPPPKAACSLKGETSGLVLYEYNTSIWNGTSSVRAPRRSSTPLPASRSAVSLAL